MKLILILTTVLWILWLESPAQSDSSKVVLITVDDAIHPACADYIHTGIQVAEETAANCIVIKLNTPGGLLKSTRVIVSELLESKIPVIVYVSPSGSQAASAGVFITLAGHIAAMAPGTNIGAAHPVSLMGMQDSVMMEKATNDAAAFIRTISERRNRNVEWAEDAVRKSLSITAKEALEIEVIDLIATDLEELLELADGMEVETTEGKTTLMTRDAVVIEVAMTLTQKLLSILSDPNLAYILLMFGIYGLFFELYSPGAIFPGVIGGICIILAFYSMHTLPVNYAGLALIVFAVILFILEIKVVSHGLLSIGGVIALFLGSIMLIDKESFLDAMDISLDIIILMVALTAAFFLLAITFSIRAHRKKVATGHKGIVGEEGQAITHLKPEGDVRVHGEIWRAESLEGDIGKGSAVLITGIEKLKLKVKKLDSST
jgi:membrane-bound serine protease (ClpP class)